MSRIVRTSFVRARSSASLLMRSMYAVEKCVPVINSARLCAMYGLVDHRLRRSPCRRSSRAGRSAGNVSVSLMPSTTAPVRRERIDADMADVAAFARDRLDQETPQRVVADARDQRRP